MILIDASHRFANTDLLSSKNKHDALAGAPSHAKATQRPGARLWPGGDAQSGCAFANPYFKPDHSHLGALAAASDASAAAAAAQAAASAQAAARLQQDAAAAAAASAAAAIRRGGAAESSHDQLHFIESHIANLHNRQVTSSVNELSVLGNSRNGSDSSGGSSSSGKCGRTTCNGQTTAASQLLSMIDHRAREPRAHSMITHSLDSLVLITHGLQCTRLSNTQTRDWRAWPRADNRRTRRRTASST